jgi:hypothetical protein
MSMFGSPFTGTKTATLRCDNVSGSVHVVLARGFQLQFLPEGGIPVIAGKECDKDAKLRRASYIVELLN